MIRVYTICNSQSDQGLKYLPFSAVLSVSTVIAILSSLISIYSTCHSQQADQCLHCLPFSAVWSWSILFAALRSLIKVMVYTVILRNSLIRVYTNCHSQQSDQGLQCLPFSAVCSGSPLFAIVIGLIRAYTVSHSQQCDQCLHYWLFSVWLLLYLPFSAVWSGSIQFLILSKQYDYDLHCSAFSAVWSVSTLLAILSSFIKVKVDIGILRNSLIRVHAICNSQQSIKVHIVILRNSLIRVCNIFHSQ